MELRIGHIIPKSLDEGRGEFEPGMTKVSLGGEDNTVKVQAPASRINDVTQSLPIHEVKK
jgi:hypothetical protein